MIARLLLVCSLLSASALAGCSEHRSREARASENQSLAAVVTGQSQNPACDAALWQHVYKPERLQVLDACKTVTGVVQDVEPDEDGDMHAVLLLDPGQENLVNKRNKKKKSSGLVIEIVCSVQPKSPKSAIKACAGYQASLAMPSAGTHARVSGSYVFDTHNGWNEIHPVSKIETLK